MMCAVPCWLSLAVACWLLIVVRSVFGVIWFVVYCLLRVVCGLRVACCLLCLADYCVLCTV